MLDNFKQSSFKISEPTIEYSFQKDFYSISILALVLLFLRLDFSHVTNNIELTTIAYAKSMIADNNYLVSQLLGEYYFDQGPFVSWIYIFLLKVFGEMPVIHRFITSMIGFSSLGVIYYLVSIKYNPRICWITTLLLIVSPLFFLLSGTLSPDIFFSMSLIIFLFSFWEIVCTNSPVNKVMHGVMYTSFTITFLIGGLLSIYYLLLVLFINKILNHNLSIKLSNLISLIGLIYLILCCLYLFLVGSKFSGFIYEYLILQYWQELVFFDYRILISFVLLVGCFIFSGFPWSLLFLGTLIGRSNAAIIINEHQKYLLSIMIAGAIIFSHLKTYEMVIMVNMLFPSFIFVASIIDEYRLLRATPIIISVVNKIFLSACALSVMLIAYVILQVDVSIMEKAIFTVMVLCLLVLPYSCLKTILKYGLYHVFARLALYNVSLLITVTQYKNILLN